MTTPRAAIGTRHRARKWWPCAVCIDHIAPGNRHWRIDGRRWCCWCALLLLLYIAPEDSEIAKDIAYPWEHAQ
jgi:hypothetical protein